MTRTCLLGWVLVAGFCLSACASSSVNRENDPRYVRLDRIGASLIASLPAGTTALFQIDERSPDYYSDFDRAKNRVVISSRLYAFVGSDDELAYLLADALAHKMLGQRRSQADTFYDGTPKGPLGSLLLKEDGGYSPEDEAIAQREAFLYMRQAGFDPEKGSRIVERLRRAEGSGRYAWLSVHPVPSSSTNGSMSLDALNKQKRQAEATLQAYLDAKQRGDAAEEKRLESVLFGQAESLAQQGEAVSS